MASNSSTSEAGGGFVAGTMIHTKAGLVPIEKIKVGDLVLSRTANGETAYSRVTKTFEFADQEVWYISYAPCGNRREGEAVAGLFFVATGIQELWVRGTEDWMVGVFIDEAIERCWLTAKSVFPGMLLELYDGREISVTRSQQLMQMAQPQFGWLRGSFADENFENGDAGSVIDFSGAFPKGFPNDGRGSWSRHQLIPNDITYDPDNGPWWKCKVFNIEVEGTHTFFVDALGVLVGDATSRESKASKT